VVVVSIIEEPLPDCHHLGEVKVVKLHHPVVNPFEPGVEAATGIYHHPVWEPGEEVPDVFIVALCPHGDMGHQAALQSAGHQVPGQPIIRAGQEFVKAGGDLQRPPVVQDRLIRPGIGGMAVQGEERGRAKVSHPEFGQGLISLFRDVFLGNKYCEKDVEIPAAHGFSSLGIYQIVTF
jgi:hypothetical protein